MLSEEVIRIIEEAYEREHYTLEMALKMFDSNSATTLRHRERCVALLDLMEDLDIITHRESALEMSKLY